MSQKDAFPKLYRIPKKTNVKEAIGREPVTSSPLVKTGISGLGTQKAKVSKVPEKRKLREEKAGRQEENKRKHSQCLNRQSKTSVNRDPIELLDSIWKEMEEDDKKQYGRGLGEGCFTPPGSPLYQHTSTPTPSTSQSKFTKYELLNAPKDDTVLKRLMCKTGLMERILAYKIKNSKMETYRNMRIHGKLDECLMPSDEGVNYGTPQFDMDSKQVRGPRTPPGRGPQTPPGSPEIESNLSHDEEVKCYKISRNDGANRTQGSCRNSPDEADEQNMPKTPPVENSCSSNKTEDGECSFILPPPPPPPPMIIRSASPVHAIARLPHQTLILPVDLSKPPPTNIMVGQVDVSKPPPGFQNGNISAPHPFLSINVPPPKLPPFHTTISTQNDNLLYPLHVQRVVPLQAPVERGNLFVPVREKPPTNIGPPLLPPIERPERMKFPYSIDTSRPPPPAPSQRQNFHTPFNSFALGVPPRGVMNHPFGPRRFRPMIPPPNNNNT